LKKIERGSNTFTIKNNVSGYSCSYRFRNKMKIPIDFTVKLIYTHNDNSGYLNIIQGGQTKSTLRSINQSYTFRVDNDEEVLVYYSRPISGIDFEFTVKTKPTVGY
jgi:hypothetical protein